ncbi:hypothetical protein [Kitasatospora sp. NPDC057223]|uniref:hypothetical protein n=1 Tax=Kitasatospora sp. NPDC057223 TaxID=3346055 RepID=UPI0036388A30
MSHRPANRRAVVGFTAVALAAVAAGCASTSQHSAPSAPPQPPQPQSLQAEGVASQEFGLLAGSGWAQAWSLWSESAQQAISQADFVRLNTECPTALGVPYVIRHSTTVDQNTVLIAWNRAGTTGSSTLVHESGRWRFVPDDESLAEYRLGPDALVQQRKAAGACRAD